MISPSSALAWSLCRLQWWIANAAKAAPSNVEAAHLMRGTAAHAPLEAAYKAAARRANTTVTRTMRAYEAEALDALEPFRAQLDEVTFMEVTGAVLELLDALPIPAPKSIIAVERAFTFDYGSSTFTGRIDLALKTSRRSVHVRDWKWSSRPPLDNRQSATYHEAARRMFPWAEVVTVGFYSIKHRIENRGTLDPGTVHYRLDQMAYVDDEQRDMLALAAEPGTDALALFPPHTGEHCSSCRFQAYCPAYQGPPSPLAFDADDVAATREDLLSRLVAR